ncbi:MAG: type II secretion system minor pseudopilin GspH [Magnetococcales bacterium]|nr:type II secretion system minor pseudopilin GspH [Magnetococcales bacterium]
MKPGHELRDTDSSEYGFTLLELLVVFFIIALLSGLAVVSIRTNDPAAMVTEEARRLRELLDMVARESVLTFRETGVRLTPNGFSFWSRDDNGKWLPIAGDDLLRERFLPDGMTFSVWVEDVPMALADDEQKQNNDESEKEKPKPHLFFFSSGDRTPFRIRIQSRTGIWNEVTGGMVGAIKVERPES